MTQRFVAMSFTFTDLTICHSLLGLFGAYGLAMADQCWRVPLLGRPLPDDCLGAALG